MSDLDGNFQLAEQLDWHWREQLRPRLNGMTHEEYRREPVALAARTWYRWQFDGKGA